MMLLAGESTRDIDFRGTYQATGYPVWAGGSVLSGRKRSYGC